MTDEQNGFDNPFSSVGDKKMLNTPLAQNTAIVAILGIPVVVFVYWMISAAVESHRNYRNSLKGN